MSTPRDLERFRERYEALLPVPALPGDRNWLDRVSSWEDFVLHGATAAENLRAEDPWFPEEKARAYAMYPQMADLVIEAFPDHS